MHFLGSGVSATARGDNYDIYGSNSRGLVHFEITKEKRNGLPERHSAVTVDIIVGDPAQ